MCTNILHCDPLTTGMIQDKLKEGDFAAAREIVLQQCGVFNQDENLQEILDACMSKGNLAEAKKTALSMGSFIGQQDALEKILDKELEKGDFVSAVDISALLLQETAVIKVAEKIKGATLNPESLKEIEEAARGKFKIYPYLKIIILKALKGLYQALGQTSDATRLGLDIHSLQVRLSLFSNERFEFRFGGAPKDALKKRDLAALTGLCIGSGVGSLANSILLGSVAGGAVALGYNFPSLRKIQNVMGLGAGLAASATTSLSVPAVLGIGLGTAVAARIPMVQSAARGTINLAGFFTGVLLGGVFYSGKEMLSLAKKSANLVTTAASSTFSAIGFVVCKVDSALDKITLQK